MMTTTWNGPSERLENSLARLDTQSFGLDDLQALERLLLEDGTFQFPVLKTGLFPGAAVHSSTEYTGYGNVWVRDNIHIAHAHYVVGHTAVTVRATDALAQHFSNQRPRFQKIIDGEVSPLKAADRPHVRFDGRNFEELPQQWAHAQNDALGYFLWLYCRLIRHQRLTLSSEKLNMLALFPRFLAAIEYWQDADSGHWEEERRVCASSIGVVLGGLCELKQMAEGLPTGQRDEVTGGKQFIDSLISEGEKALDAILPAECVAPPEKERQYDAALLFLAYPIETVEGEMANSVVERVIENLQGSIGVRRYLGDSFWAPDYKKRLAPELRTSDWSEDMSGRDQLAEPGNEAQWCIFDPILSIIAGRHFQADHDPEHLQRQMAHFRRSLAQLTPDETSGGMLRCPELYYLEDGRWQPNDTTPLLWTQANLMVALKEMKDSLSVQAGT